MKSDTLDDRDTSTTRRARKDSIKEKISSEFDINARLPWLTKDNKCNVTAVRKCLDNSRLSSSTKSLGKPFRSRLTTIPVNPNCQYLKTIADVDPHFYSIVANRPIKQKQDLRSYKNDLRKILISRITKGFLEEELLKSEREFDNEEACYNAALKQFNDQEKSFQQFLAHDHDTAQAMLKQVREKEKELSLVTEEYEHYAFKLAKVKSQITFMNEGRLLLLSYEAFLYGVSPRQWKLENIISSYLYLSPKIGELSTFNIFNSDLGELKTELQSVKEPKLYFKTPDELISLFEMLQDQNLFYLLKAESMDSQKNILCSSRQNIKECFDQEIGHIKQVLCDLTASTEWLEEQAIELQNVFLRILSKHFRDLVASEHILKIHTHVEFVYKRIIYKDFISMTALEMVQDLETEYNMIINDLETLDYTAVKSIEKKSFAEDLLLMKKARKANKQLENFTKVQKRLIKSYDPPANVQTLSKCFKASSSIEKPSKNIISTSAPNRISRMPK